MNYTNFQYAALDGVALLLVPSGQFGGQELPTDCFSSVSSFFKQHKVWLVGGGLLAGSCHVA